MGTLTNKEKADYLDKLELELRRNYVDKNEATAVLRLKGFYGDWLEVGIVFNKDYEVYKKVMIDELIKGITTHTWYVVKLMRKNV